MSETQPPYRAGGAGKSTGSPRDEFIQIEIADTTGRRFPVQLSRHNTILLLNHVADNYANQLSPTDEQRLYNWIAEKENKRSQASLPRQLAEEVDDHLKSGVKDEFPAPVQALREHYLHVAEHVENNRSPLAEQQQAVAREHKQNERWSKKLRSIRGLDGRTYTASNSADDLQKLESQLIEQSYVAIDRNDLRQQRSLDIKLTAVTSWLKPHRLLQPKSLPRIRPDAELPAEIYPASVPGKYPHTRDQSLWAHLNLRSDHDAGLRSLPTHERHTLDRWIRQDKVKCIRQARQELPYDARKGYLLIFEPTGVRGVSPQATGEKMQNVLDAVQGGQAFMTSNHLKQLQERLKQRKQFLSLPENNLALLDPKTRQPLTLTPDSSRAVLRQVAQDYADGRSYCTATMRYTDYQKIERWLGRTLYLHKEHFVDRAQFEAACRAFEEGDRVLVFPEGKRSQSRMLSRESPLPELARALVASSQKTPAVAALPPQKEQLLQQWLADKQRSCGPSRLARLRRRTRLRHEPQHHR